MTRRRLDDRLDGAFGVPLAVVTAGAGYGKSTLLSSWVGDLKRAWYTVTASDASVESLARGIGDALSAAVPALRSRDPVVAAAGGSDDLGRAAELAGLLSERLHDRLRSDLFLILDDVHHLGDAPGAARLIESLCWQAPRTLHLILSSRHAPPFPIERLRSQGQLVELNGAELAFTLDEVRQLVGSSRTGDDDQFAAVLHRVTEGWPVALQLALTSLDQLSSEGERQEALARMQEPEGRLYAYLANETFSRDPPSVREFLRRVAPLQRFSAAQCRSSTLPRSDETIADLLQRGLLTRMSDGLFRLHELARDYALRTWPLAEDETRDVHDRAAAWLAGEGRPEQALHHFGAAGNWSALAELLAEQGPAMLAAGSAHRVIDAAELLPVEHRSMSTERLLGDAKLARGELEPALRCYARAINSGAAIPSALAWRIVMTHFLRGDLAQAVEVFARAAEHTGDSADDSLLLAWTAMARCRRGDVDVARELATEALRIAVDDQALAAAHAAVAMAAEAAGDLNACDLHSRRALSAAQAARQPGLQCRVRNIRASLLLGQARYVDAVSELDVALQLAELVGSGSLRALTLMNRGLCWWCLGRLDEASVDYTSAIGSYRQIGTQEVSYALIGRGDVCRERGDLALARDFYEQGLAIAERSGDRQGLVPGLYQLAKVLVDSEPERAAAMARRAVAYGWPDRAWALCAVGWIALAVGDRQAAAQAAARAEQAARELQDRFGLAESLALTAFSSADSAARGSRLEEALAIWRELGIPLRAAAVELAIARFSTGVAAQAAARRAERTLQSLGVRVSASGPAGLLRAVAAETRTPLTIDTLGGFRVRASGRTIAHASWRSKKARDLVKILVSRGGRSVSREWLMQQLWPHAPSVTLSNRLSVALSTARAVLDADRRYPTDYFIAGEKDVIRLVLDNVAVDVLMFLHDAETGLASRRGGRLVDAADRLRASEALYAGDFLEEEIYEEWARPMRDDARAIYVTVARALADDAVAAGEHEVAVRYLLRILERDRFDEGAHLALVAALLSSRRHGDAMRHYRAYSDAMRELGVQAVAFSTISVRHPMSIDTPR